MQVIAALPGYVSLALGEPVARRQYYRSAWIEFDSPAHARNAMDKLSNEDVRGPLQFNHDSMKSQHCKKIESFRLHVTLITSPLISKLKRTSILASVEERMEEDLETIKRLAVTLEKEADMLHKYEPLSDKPQNLNGGATDDVIHTTTISSKSEDAMKVEQNSGVLPPSQSNGKSEDSLALDRGTMAVEARLATILPTGDDATVKSKKVRKLVEVT